MIEINKINGFSVKFENLTIDVTEIVIEQFIALSNSNLPKDTAYTNLWQQTNSSYLGNDLDPAYLSADEKDSVVSFPKIGPFKS